MKPDVKSKCVRKYRINAILVLEGIIRKIPDKYFYGLGEVIVQDYGPKGYPYNKYFIGEIGKSKSRIEIYMDDPLVNRYPFISILFINIYYIIAFNEHIEKRLKKTSDDPEIQQYNTSRVNRNWMYFGVWSPIYMIFQFITYPFVKIVTCRDFIFKFAHRLRQRHNG